MENTLHSTEIKTMIKRLYKQQIMPITDINEFMKFFDDMSNEEIHEALDEFKPDESSAETVYAEDYLKSMKAMNTTQTFDLEFAFLVLKSNNQVFSAVHIRSRYDIVGFDCPAEVEDDWGRIPERVDWLDHYKKECEIQHLPQETEFFEIIYKTVQVDVNPF